MLKKLFISTCLLVCLNTVTSQVKQDDLLNVLTTVNTYISQIMTRNTVFSSTGIRKYLSHNDSVSSPVSWEYPSIKEKLINLKPGGYICSDISISKTYKEHIWANRTKPQDFLEDTYFIRLCFTLVAKYDEPTIDGKRRLRLLDQPIEYIRYLILIKDSDGIFKPIDAYPRVYGEFDFYSIPSILGASNILINEADKIKLCEIFLNTQP